MKIFILHQTYARYKKNVKKENFSIQNDLQINKKVKKKNVLGNSKIIFPDKIYNIRKKCW